MYHWHEFSTDYAQAYTPQVDFHALKKQSKAP